MLPSHASFSTNWTLLMIMTFLATGSYNLYHFVSSKYPTIIHFFLLFSNFYLSSSRTCAYVTQPKTFKCATLCFNLVQDSWGTMFFTLFIGHMFNMYNAVAMFNMHNAVSNTTHHKSFATKFSRLTTQCTDYTIYCALWKHT
jgi:hypothetical protein